jgi:tetratricopeptide (TPR) repeat protein
MEQNSVSPSYVAAELQARENRSNHDFGEAASSARLAAEIARADGDLDSWWNMTFFQAENLLDAEDFDKCAGLATGLVNGPRATADRHDRARTYILLAKAKQGAGQLEQAADDARAAVALVSDEPDVETNVKARQALIAALADTGRLDEAWAECLALADVISAEVDDQLVGKAYWVIGNVAFLCNNVQQGLNYHDLAAATFSPARNLDVWAKFNKASAAMRLAADIADTDTLRCIERAELATDVIGGSANDFLLLKLNRAHWSSLAGDTAAAIELLEQVCADEEKTSPQMSPQILGEACLLLGRANAATGNQAAAREHLLKAADHFERAGAPQRADQARQFLASEA